VGSKWIENTCSGLLCSGLMGMLLTKTALCVGAKGLFLFGFIGVIYAQVWQSGPVSLNAMPTVREERNQCDWQPYIFPVDLNAEVDNGPCHGLDLDYRVRS
jgi:hypothetical protein